MNLKYLFLALTILFAAIGFGCMAFGQNSMAARFEGGAKGLAGVFFILFYIFLLLGKQPLDKTGGH